MKHFILKTFIFILPAVIINNFLLLSGYLFSTKNDYVLIHNLRSYEPGKLNIKFFGTSRIENGISPDDIENGFSEVTKRNKVQVNNCGMNSMMTGWGLMMQEKYFAPCDLMIIEIYPGKDPMQDNAKINLPISISSYLDQFISFYINHYLVVQYLPTLISDLRGRSPIKYMNAHLNGWTESHYYRENSRLDPIKKRVAGWAEDDLRIKEFIQGWDQFTTEIKHLQNHSSCKLMFIRMPVNGRLLEVNEEFITQFNPMQYLKHSFPYASFIDANQDPLLKSISTIEDSHLDGLDAKIFSEKLGQILAKNYYSN